MVPDFTQEISWRTFQQQVQALQRLCQSVAERAPADQISTALQHLRSRFQQQIDYGLETLGETARTQRHITELHRLLRLLLTDVALYQSARSDDLQRQRLKQLSDRLAQLSDHVQALLIGAAG